MKNFEERVSLVDTYAAEKKTEEAVCLLFDLIGECLKQRAFTKAESLRDKIYAVDAFALNAIIRSNELIEEAKDSAIDKGHKQIWSRLYDSLTPEESNALYYSLEEHTHAPDNVILRQGELSPHLVLLDQGKAQVYYTLKGKDFFVKTLDPGMIAGEASFFTETVSTVSLVAITPCQVHCLHKDKLAEWGDRFPMLEEKLKVYCQELEKMTETLTRKGLDRRLFKRAQAFGPVEFQIINADGKVIKGGFKGLLVDVSKGGVSFLVKANKSTAHLMLGRRLKVNVSPKTEGKDCLLEMTGQVIAVQFQPMVSEAQNDYSIHFRGNEALQEEIFDAISRYAKTRVKRSV